MRYAAIMFTIVFALLSQDGFAQFGGGGSIYTRPDGGGAKLRARQAEAQNRVVSKEELPPTGTSTLIDAAVLYNAKADGYVAVFAIALQGESVAECNRKMSEKVAAFTKALDGLGIKPDDIFADFIAQTRLYEYELSTNVATEKPAGFEQKKNVSVRFRETALLDKILAAAAELEIFDLVKVDYLLDDMEAIRNRMSEEAARVIKQKVERYRKLLGINLRGAQVYAEKSGVHFPSELYDTYTAAEGENVRTPFDRQQYIVQEARKSRTGYFNGLDSDGFDTVINPVILEPVVQLTLYVKVRYESEPAK